MPERDDERTRDRRLNRRGASRDRRAPVGIDTVVVFAGGDAMGRPGGPLPDGDVVVAADSGLELAQRFGYEVDLVVGDLDSVSPDALAAAEAGGARVERHPVAKDATDLELAIDAALAHDPRRIVVVGGYGGRVDHFLAGALALTRDESAAVEVEALMGPARLYVVRNTVSIDGRWGELLSLIPVRGPAGGVVTEGLLYPLVGETLHPGSTRGVSNQLAGPTAGVRLESGVLLAVLPGEQGPELPSPARTDSNESDSDSDSEEHP